jgi:hypothetical protein
MLPRSLLFPAALGAVVATVPGAAQATSTTCSTSAVCAEYINTYTYSSGATTGGVAIHGEADNGIGVRGTSVSNVGFYGASGSGAELSPGVEGESTQGGSGAGGGFGLAALANPSQAPAYGVETQGIFYGLGSVAVSLGASPSSAGYGVEGLDYGGGKNGDYNAGAFGESFFGTGVLAESNKVTPAAGIYGQAPVGVYALADSVQNTTPSPYAYAFVGETNDVGLELRNTANATMTFAATPLFFMIGTGTSSGSGYFYIAYSGDEKLSGTMTTSKSTYVRTIGSSGAAVREYTTRGTSPSVEDFGEARLANGRAFVPIDARFADTIDPRSPYLVFVTAEGDCNGLYVAEKTPAGFVVRERRGGRSSLAFQYRIAAKPIDENGTRLEAMAADSTPTANERDFRRTPEHIARPLTPLERMQEELGPERYATALNALRARLAVTR